MSNFSKFYGTITNDIFLPGFWLNLLKCGNSKITDSMMFSLVIAFLGLFAILFYHQKSSKSSKSVRYITRELYLMTFLSVFFQLLFLLPRNKHLFQHPVKVLLSSQSLQIEEYLTILLAFLSVLYFICSFFIRITWLNLFISVVFLTFKINISMTEFKLLFSGVAKYFGRGNAGVFTVYFSVFFIFVALYTLIAWVQIKLHYIRLRYSLLKEEKKNQVSYQSVTYIE